MKVTNKFLKEWKIAFRAGGSKHLYNRKVIDVLDSFKMDLNELQMHINTVKTISVAKRNKLDHKLVKIHASLTAERRAKIEEDLACSTIGMVHLSKAQLHNSEKAELQVNTNSIAAILKGELKE